jgi:hypothetical protein
MKCPSCAANYDDKFSFCPYCGSSKPQPPTVRLQVEQPVPVRVQEPKYEYCKIDDCIIRNGGVFDTWTIYVYEARGTGANYNLLHGRSQKFLHHHTRIPEDMDKPRYRQEKDEATTALRNLIAELERQGWQEYEPEKQIFRRQVQ